MVYIIGLFNLIISIKSITDPDYGWHISVGKYIFSNSIIPKTDIFSWYGEVNNLNFISHEWLSDLIMYLVGPIGMIAILSIFVTIFYLFLVKFLKVSKVFNLSNLIKILWLFLCVTSMCSFNHRPYLFSYLLFLIFITILFKYLDFNLNNFKLLYIIPILQLLWVNLHGGSSSLIPLILILSILYKLIFNKYFDKKLFLIFIFSILLSFINPYSYKILIYPFINMGDNNMINSISEWFSPNFHGLIGIYYFIIVVIPILVFVFSNKKKLNYFDLIVYFMFLFMMFRSVRFMHYYMFVSTYFVGKYVYDFKVLPMKLNMKLIKIFAYLIFSLMFLYLSINQLSSFSLYNYKYEYSDEAIEKLKELKPKHLFNDYNTGGYLTYKLYDDDIKIFINGIADIYSSNILIDSYNLENLCEDPNEILLKYDFDVIIIQRGLPLEWYLSERKDFHMYYSDDTSIIFVRI